MYAAYLLVSFQEILKQIKNNAEYYNGNSLSKSPADNNLIMGPSLEQKGINYMRREYAILNYFKRKVH